jgi:SAM-dependent methyltransferase
MLGLTKEHSVAWLGVGLGGPAREMSRQTGAWISGFEHRSDLVTLAQEQCLMSGLAKRVSVTHYDAATLELPVKKFNTVIARDEFCFQEAKAHLLEQAYEGLKVGGTLLFTDYVSEDPDAAASWFGNSWGEPRLWSGRAYTDTLTAIGFDLRGKVDISDLYADFIARSAADWSRLMDQVSSGDMPVPDMERAELLHLMSEDAERWAARMHALRAGDLKVLRFTALRPESVL